MSSDEELNEHHKRFVEDFLEFDYPEDDYLGIIKKIILDRSRVDGVVAGYCRYGDIGTSTLNDCQFDFDPDAFKLRQDLITLPSIFQY